MTLLLQGAGLQSLGGGGPPPGFTVDGVTLDGTDYLSRVIPTGAADNSMMTASFWLRTTSSAYTALLYFGTAGNGIWMNTSGIIETYLPRAGGGLWIIIGNAVLNDGDWHHVAFSASTNFSDGNKLFKLAIDGADDTPVVTDGTAAGNIDIAPGGWWIGSDEFIENLTGDLAEFYVAIGIYLDVTDSANNQKFRTSGGKPEDLGADGSTPTGSQPIVYLHIDDGEAAANFAVNAGSGGDFTITGTLATASTSPSD